ncbi:MAG: PVC-type heme-binding CxxCH protein [Aureliella sp.]
MPTSPCQADENAAADHSVVEALMRLPSVDLSELPEQKKAVLRFLTRSVGTGDYIRVAKQFGVTEQTEELTGMLCDPEAGTLAVEAARLLVRGKQFDALKTVLAGDSVPAASAATALGYLEHQRVHELLSEKFLDKGASPQVRIASAVALGRTENGQEFLLSQAKSGNVPASARFAVRDTLLASRNEAIRRSAADLLNDVAQTKSKPLPPISKMVAMRGDGERGKEVFRSVGTCNKCHKVLGEGKEIGPDLSEIGSKLSREDMYVAILNPSAAISHNYETYTLLDADDRILSGLLMNQTDESVTIRDAEGIDHSVVADDVVSLKVQDVSLMPADLQKAMTLQDLTDLVDYLVLLRKKDEGGFNVLAGPKETVNPGHDPNDAVAGFDIAEGVQVELFASEPQLLSPTSIDVDAKGRVWVCEAVNYRHFRNHQNKERAEGDRILVLEDTDGDGVADKQTVFYQDKEIDSPHGVCVLGQQIIVSAGENVIVFTDEDDDLVPDSKRYLFTGISGVQHDHGIHAFNIGPDGKLYFNFGNEGKQLKGPNGETIIDQAGNVVDDSRNPYQQGMVFRCNLDGSELETLGWNFRNNWELCVDSFGTMWQSDNDDDGNRGTRINYVMDFGNYGYRDELTGASWRAARIGQAGEIPLQHWHLNDPGVVPNILQTGAGSPTGICVYEGDLLPEPFRNQVIHTDPGPNVVRAYPVELDGAGYQASIRNLVKGVRDPWFRPVDVCPAPDGSLFIADWYDPGVGGHRMGDIQHGRIFRVVPEGHQGYSVPSLELDTPAGVMAALASPNQATRFLAQQEIRNHPERFSSALQEMANDGSSDRMRARAIWQLATTSTKSKQAVDQALKDANPDIRVAGVRLARQMKWDSLDLVERMKSDSSPQVRRELLISLRHQKDPAAAKLWAELAMQHDGKDRWYLEALGIAADQQWDACFDAWLALAGDQWNTPAGRDIVWRCRSPKACRYLSEIIRSVKTIEEQYRYFRAFDFHEGEPKLEALNALLSAAR